MENISIQHLNSIKIEPNCVLTLEYSEPDQGGTSLLYRFHITQNGEVKTESGYLHDMDFKTKRVPINDVPLRVVDDALAWVVEQLRYAPSGLLLTVLDSFQKMLSSAHRPNDQKQSASNR